MYFAAGPPYLAPCILKDAKISLIAISSCALMVISAQFSSTFAADEAPGIGTITGFPSFPLKHLTHASANCAAVHPFSRQFLQPPHNFQILVKRIMLKSWKMSPMVSLCKVLKIRNLPVNIPCPMGEYAEMGIPNSAHVVAAPFVRISFCPQR